MKKGYITCAAIAALLTALPAHAQYSDIVNGITNALMPALSGSSSYKGFVEGNYSQGFGKYRTNFATISTSQGYQFNNWFFMGAGIGVDVLWSTVEQGWGDQWIDASPSWKDNSYTSSAVMIPVFTDFRFSIGNRSQTSLFIDLKVGASFLCTNSYVKIRQGYLTNTTYFYLQPAIGLRVPVNRQNEKQAVNVGIHYRLLTSDYWSGYQADICLNSIGLNVSFEW